MQNEVDKIWTIVLSEIQTEISKATFLTLFRNTALLSLEETTATIAAPSIMVIDLLQKRFYQLIKKSLDKNTQKNINIIFIPKNVNGHKKEDSKDTPLFSTNQAQSVAGHLPRVRSDYTFQNMAVSSSNQLAYVSCQTVAKNPGTMYNPLFIYGPVGVGKTHLMQSIANEVYQKNPDKKIIYITSEEFTNEVVEAIRTNTTAKMKKKFRSSELLIIDDVQFLAGKEKIMEELFHTFNSLVDASCQIVLSSDRPPHEIKKLEKRLSSRFSGGLTVDIEAPDFELRCAILLIKAKKYNIELPMDTAKAIAEKIQDVRNLEGTLLRIVTQAQASEQEITTLYAQSVLNNKKIEQKGRLHPDDLIKNVCDFYSVKLTQLRGPKREASLVKARQVSMFLLKKHLNLTYVEIGNLLGGRDHTTIIHGVDKIEASLLESPSLNEDIMGITKIIA